MKKSEQLIWFAVLSCLLPSPGLTNDCKIATSTVSATCAAAGTVAGAVGGITCAATLGIGCAVAIAGAAVGAACTSVSDNIDCDGNPSGTVSNEAIMEKLGQIIGFLEDIQNAVEDVYNSIELGFFEQKYNEYIHKIRAAASRYKIDVLQKSSYSPQEGLINDTLWARQWADDVLGDGDYNCRGALDIIDEMVVGAPSYTGRDTPSVYELASKHGLCSHRLYDLISSLIVEGTTLAFTAMEIRGDGIHESDKIQLKNRLQSNNVTFHSQCSKLTPGGTITYSGWSNSNYRGFTISRRCPPNRAVESLQWKEQNGYGLVEVVMGCGEGSSIEFTGNRNGFNNREIECDETGKFNGFSAVKGREQHGYGIINTEMLCYDTGSSAWYTSNGNFRGFENSALRCPQDSVVTGMELREQHGYGIINFRTRCTKLVAADIPANPPITDRRVTWTSWSNGNTRGHILKKVCPRNHAVEGLQWREQHGYGLIEVYMDCGYGDEIPFTRNTRGFRNAKGGCSSSSSYGFKAVQGREQHGYGIIDTKMMCTGGGSQWRSSPNDNGFWNTLYSCPNGYVITGLEVREQHGYGIVNFRARCSEWNLKA